MKMKLRRESAEKRDPPPQEVGEKITSGQVPESISVSFENVNLLLDFIFKFINLRSSMYSGNTRLLWKIRVVA